MPKNHVDLRRDLQNLSSRQSFTEFLQRVFGENSPCDYSLESIENLIYRYERTR